MRGSFGREPYEAREIITKRERIEYYRAERRLTLFVDNTPILVKSIEIAKNVGNAHRNSKEKKRKS